MSRTMYNRRRGEVDNTQARDLLKCRLYRWENRHTEGDYFHPFGPFDPARNQRLLQHAAHCEQRWFCVVSAYFLNEAGDYYEEQLVTEPLGPFVLTDMLDEVVEMAKVLVAEASESGDAAHYQDTCVALYPYSPQLAQQFENDTWVERQAEKRAKLIFQQQEEQAHAATG